MEGRWLPAFAFLLLSLLWAPTICSVVGCWLDSLLDSLRNRLASDAVPSSLQPFFTPSPALCAGNGGLQVVLCGFPRTGTLSLTEALRILGFRCLHGVHLSYAPTVKRFMKAYKHDNPKDWEKLCEGFTAVSDYPATCAYRQLARVYPNAKIILNIRDANKWYDSFSNTVLRVIQGDDHMVFKIVPTYVAECLKKTLCRQFFEGKPEDRDICVRAFLQHIQDVKDYVPPEKLLVYDVEKGEGWSDLCRFLNVPVPEVPFPKTNSKDSFNDTRKRVGNVYMMEADETASSPACLLT